MQARTRDGALTERAATRSRTPRGRVRVPAGALAVAVAAWCCAVPAVAGEQIVVPSIAEDGGGTFAVDLDYSTADPENNNLPGLAIRIHFDASVLALRGVSEVLQQGLIGHDDAARADTADADADPKTDSLVVMAWADMRAEWPGEGSPSRLARLTFTRVGDSAPTRISVTAQESAPGYSLSPRSVAVPAVSVAP